MWSIPKTLILNASDVTVGTAIVMIHQVLARRTRRQLDALPDRPAAELAPLRR